MNSDRQQAVENYRSPFESLRVNGGVVEMIEYFPFVLSFVEALLSFSKFEQRGWVSVHQAS